MDAKPLHRVESHVGAPCPACGAVLRDTTESLLLQRPAGVAPALLAVYRCEGNPSHWWREDVGIRRTLVAFSEDASLPSNLQRLKAG